jgi:hypothetical protein
LIWTAVAKDASPYLSAKGKITHALGRNQHYVVHQNLLKHGFRIYQEAETHEAALWVELVNMTIQITVHRDEV